MYQLFHVALYQPIFNLLVFLYNLVGSDIGIAIILITIIIKLVLYPLTSKSLKSQKDLQKIQPKISELQKKYKNDKQKLSQELMSLYKQEKVNPFSSCFPMLIQFPFLIAIYIVFRNGLTDPQALSALYPFIQNPGQLNPVTLGRVDLSKVNLYLAVLAGLAQFFQTKMLISKKPPMNVPGSKDEGMTAMINKQMTYMMPVLTIFIGASLPGGLMLYWLTTTVLTVGQQYLLFKGTKKNPLINSPRHSSGSSTGSPLRSEKVIEGHVVEKKDDKKS